MNIWQSILILVLGIVAGFLIGKKYMKDSFQVRLEEGNLISYNPKTSQWCCNDSSLYNFLETMSGHKIVIYYDRDDKKWHAHKTAINSFKKSLEEGNIFYE